MKIVLVQPPVRDFYDTDVRLQPIGLCSLKAVLGKFLPEIKVVVRDFHHGYGRRTIAIPSELAYLKPYYQFNDESPFSTFHHYWHFGASFEEIAETVAKERPDLVGISSLFSPYYREALECARVIKRATGAKILLGGSHVSAMPERMLSDPNVDFIIRGEGEKPFVNLIQALLSGANFADVAGLGYKTEAILHLNEVGENYPIDEIPMPDLSDLKPDRYRLHGQPLSFLITSRSCPHKCSFCSVHTTFGHSYRRRSVDPVIQEIKERYKEGYRVFDFEDDNLTYFREEMKELCRRLIHEFPNKEARFVAMNGISYLSLDRELLSLMREANFTDLNLSLVTSNKTVRETTKRPHTIEKYIQTVEEAAKLGFHITSYQILGLPEEEISSMAQTMSFAARFPLLIGVSPFYLTPSSPIARDFPPPDETSVFRARLSALCADADDSRRRDVYTLFITARILNFLKSSAGTGVDLKSALDVFRKMPGRGGAGGEILSRLFSEGRLFAKERNSYHENHLFNARLFFDVCEGAGYLSTLRGGRVELKLPVIV